MTIEVATDPEKDFSAAFANFAEPEKSAEGENNGEPAAAEPAPAADPAPADDNGNDPDPAGEPAAPEPAASEPGGDEPSAAEPAEPEPAAEPTVEGVDTDDILKRLAAAIKEKPAEEPAPAPAATEEPPAIYSSEEQAVLDSYEKEWPEVAKAEALKRRAEYRELLNFAFQEIAKQFIPIKEMTEALAERTHLSDVKTAVPDYSDDLRSNVITWVDKQPAYLQAAYKQVIQQGTSEEVKDLIDRYRKEAGTGAPAPTPSKKVTELSEPAKKAAAALAPVETKRTTPPAQDDMSNFDAAFANFARDFGQT